MEQLEGKVAVVTGAGSGVGEGIVDACVDAGMRVVVADIDLEGAERVAEAARERGAEAIAVEVDVSDRIAMDALAERAYEEFGEVNLLCCNAGVIVETSIEDSTDADWEWLFRVNVMGVVHGAQAFAPRMREQEGEAHIVNTGSIAGLFVPPLDVGTYAASKHAVIALTDRLRHEVADAGIGVSVLCPGGVTTRLFEGHRNVPADLADQVTPATRTDGAGGMAPAEVGGRVLDAVRADRFWIITHARGDDLAVIDERYEALHAAYEWPGIAEATAMEQLEGKVAVVTGGGSGIGQGIVGACVEAGMRVVIADIDLESAERVASAARESGVEAIAVEVDVSDRTAMDALAERAYEEFGEVNLLCCNAGVIVETSIVDSTDADWEWLFRVNVMGAVHGAQAFVPRMREQAGEAHIVNTSSMAGLTVPPVNVAVYAASKHAVVALTDRLRHEVADDGISVSVLCPGGVASRLFEGHRHAPEDLADKITPALRTEGRGRMSPALVGRRVLDAVRAGRFWVITHPRERERVDERYEEIRADFAWALERA